MRSGEAAVLRAGDTVQHSVFVDCQGVILKNEYPIISLQWRSGKIWRRHFRDLGDVIRIAHSDNRGRHRQCAA